MHKPKHLYYIAHISNLKSILKNGLLSHNQANKWRLKNIISKRHSIYNPSVIEQRKSKQFRNRPLLDYANVYFQARNPMLYQVVKQYTSQKIVVLELDADIINIPLAGVSDGNAANAVTRIYTDINKGLAVLDQQVFKKNYWLDIEDGKRKIMAEVLIPDKIPTKHIIGLYTDSQSTSQSVKADLKRLLGSISVMPQPQMFFRPQFQKALNQKITLLKEDMFFSEQQTLTISVNTVGVMGRGLAARAKYQAPDVYVFYQDLCRQGKLKMGVPYLYKRAGNFVKSLMEDASPKEISSIVENGHRWFLLFPTKNHWRTSSPLSGIEQGLKWLVSHYKEQGIKSLALPALGCGLGGLSWKQAGPLMCRYLNKMDIKSWVYLPLENPPPSEQLDLEFLLPKNN